MLLRVTSLKHWRRWRPSQREWEVARPARLRVPLLDRLPFIRRTRRVLLRRRLVLTSRGGRLARGNRPCPAGTVPPWFRRPSHRDRWSPPTFRAWSLRSLPHRESFPPHTVPLKRRTERVGVSTFGRARSGKHWQRSPKRRKKTTTPNYNWKERRRWSYVGNGTNRTRPLGRRIKEKPSRVTLRGRSWSARL